MMGCLAAPFRMLGCLILLAGIAFGWLYRDRISGEARRLLGGDSPPPPASIGRPGVRALESARAKIDSLNGWRADSIVLTPSELASLIGAGLAPELRGQLDSLQAYARDGELAVRAKLKTARLPKELVGPLAIVLKPTELVEAVGPLEVVRSGRAEWTVQSFKIRNFPIPQKLLPRLVERVFGSSARPTVPVHIPEGIRRIRCQPSGATVYGAPQS